MGRAAAVGRYSPAMDTDLPVKIATGALGGAAAALLLASTIAHRQEIGKARANALIELRELVAGQSAYNEFHHLRTQGQGSHVGDPLSVQHAAAVACKVVALAWRLSARQQRRVRKALVRIFGEATVRCAEQLALTPFDKGHVVRDAGTWSAAQLRAGLALKPGDTETGSFDAFSKNPGDADAYKPIVADMGRLRKAVGGGRPKLGQRWWSRG